MPISRLKDIRAMSSEDRKKRVTELRTELMRLKTMIKAGGAVENPGRVRELRKAIAHLLTVESEQPMQAQEEENEKKKESKKA
ncbi:MAG: 50S ribosomal protein L29 [Candidatus Bathyarchaeota archaeon]|jgi:large subunit ribosomal protein L29